MSEPVGEGMEIVPQEVYTITHLMDREKWASNSLVAEGGLMCPC